MFFTAAIIYMSVSSVVSAQTETVSVSEAPLRQWIKELTSDDYVVRERAAESLERAGMAAEVALCEAAESVDLETQMQARRILAIIRETAVENQVKAFELDVDGSRGISLAGWKHVHAQLGDSAAARNMFVRLYRAEPRLFAAYEKDREKIGDAFSERVSEIQKTLQNRNTMRIHYNFRDTAATLRDNTLAILLIGSDPKVVVDTSAIQRFDRLIQQVIPANQMGNQAVASLTREWFGKWIEHKSTDVSLEHRHITLGMMYGTEKTLRIAERTLRRENTDPRRGMWAALCAAKFGDARHVELIEPLLDDENTVHSSSSNVNRKRVIRHAQLRDIALAVLIRLTKQNYADYGFHRTAEHPLYVFQLQTIYFEKPTDREKALKKWREWRTLHPANTENGDANGETE